MASSINASTSGAGGLITTADNTGILNLQTAGTTAVTVDASQNVGIGTTGPSYKLDVVGGINASSNINTASGNFVLGTNDTYLGFASNNIKFNNTSDRIALNTGATERMRITGADVILGNTTFPAASNSGFGFNTSGSYAYFSRSAGEVLNLNRYTSTGTVIQFKYTETNVGTITVTGSATAYNTSSDYRLKENIAPMTGALDKVAQLKPVNWKWKADGSNGEGFIAHELAEVCPDAVHGEKDAVDAEGNPIYQGVDTSFLVATLTAAIQEQQTIINDLKARIETLEAK